MSEAETSTILSQLIAKRGYLKSSLTRFTNFLRDCEHAKRFTELQVRLEKVEVLLSEFEQVQYEIEIADTSAAQALERESFENSYFSAIASARDLIAKSKTLSLSPSVGGTSNSTCNNSDPIQGSIQLPKISLPEFSGAYDQWLKFHDTFKMLIHNNSSLNNIQKFYYLQSALKGKAAQVIQSLEISDGNYEVAWNLLEERFENKRNIIYTHVKALFELENVSKESHNSLRTLLDNFLMHFRALENLGQPTNSWDTLLIYLISSRLDPTTAREWQLELNKIGKDIPVLKQFIDFLGNRCQMLESVESTSVVKNKSCSRFRERTLTHLATDRIKCPLCSGEHFLQRCTNFQNLTVENRFSEAKKLRVCINCLKPSHGVQNCKASNCRKCHKKHNTLLHFERQVSNKEQSSNVAIPSISQGDKSTKNEPSEDVTVVAHSSHSEKTAIILSTAIVNVKNHVGVPIQGRALIDSGSQSNFMTKRFAERLGLPKTRINLSVMGINQSTGSVSFKTRSTISSMCSDYNAELTFLLVDRITENLPSFTFDRSMLNIPTGLSLADPTFDVINTVDILLGAEIFFDLLCSNKIKLGKNQPVLQESKLGWFISGPLKTFEIHSKTVSCHAVITNSQLHQQLEKFWSIEEYPNKNNFTEEEIACEQHFVQNVKRTSTGRFIVTLPFRKNPSELGDSKQCALRRFNSLENKLVRNPQLREQYTNFIREYEELGHMSRVADAADGSNCHYLPHHCVLKESSTTTKLRVVFDASAATTSGLSLNDILMVGPTIQNDIFSIMIRFRKHRYVLTADVEKMYRQVLVDPAQCDLQRIVWRINRDEPLTHYKLNTLTYGTASASFLAVRCLHQLAIEHQREYPRASEVILNDFYVDDLITGADSITEAITLRNDIVNILKRGGFELRKWSTNETSLIENFDISNDNSSLARDSNISKTLGIIWEPHSDTFRYDISVRNDFNEVITKRSMLSVISQIYDPLGLIGPVTIRAKLILQRLWQLKQGWDHPVDNDLREQWLRFREQVALINLIVAPRYALRNDSVEVELHGFCDASQAAYGACVYLRSTNKAGQCEVVLLAAKSRVAPLKTITLPRLELCGAVILTKLVKRAVEALQMPIREIFYWCDSTIVLSWINAQPNTWKTFVANRVGEIQASSVPSQWNHVSSVDNPADLISRGTTATDLKKSHLWWRGPPWLIQPKENWPKRMVNFPKEVAESKACTFSLVATSDQTIFDKWSSLRKLQRVIAFCFRFRQNALKNKIFGPLTTDELDYANKALVKLVQRDSFAGEIHALTGSKPIPSVSKLKTLNPFLDQHGIVRVGGRIRKAQIHYSKKHPIVLPSSHPFTTLVIRHEHERHLHCGLQATLAAVRDRYWPLNGRSSVKRVLRDCIICYRCSPKAINPPMGELPEVRVTQLRPFYSSGVDFAGPFLVKDGKLRNRSLIKTYACIFVCFSTKAVHLELVGDLSSESFLNALKRFVSRRGICKHLFSDNATNFVGANNELKQISKALASLNSNADSLKYLTDNEIKWHFTPPRSPHFGGIWEAAVKSAKFHLRRIVGNAHLTFESLYTVLTQIEAVLNSRPLAPLSDDPNDYDPLCPSHFLIGERLTAIPQTDVKEVRLNRLNHYQHLQSLVQHFWTRWSKEYLSTLQERTKWTRHHSDYLKPGTMVLLMEDNLPPLRWALGRVEQLHPGSDGVTRVVSVRSASGVSKRAANKVCVLPFCNQDRVRDNCIKNVEDK